MSRATVEQFAAETNSCAETIRRMCRAGKLVARRMGGKWQIEREKSERALSLIGGNSAERELAKKGML